MLVFVKFHFVWELITRKIDSKYLILFQSIQMFFNFPVILQYRILIKLTVHITSYKGFLIYLSEIGLNITGSTNRSFGIGLT